MVNRRQTIVITRPLGFKSRGVFIPYDNNMYLYIVTMIIIITII